MPGGGLGGPCIPTPPPPQPPGPLARQKVEEGESSAQGRPTGHQRMLRPSPCSCRQTPHLKPPSPRPPLWHPEGAGLPLIPRATPLPPPHLIPGLGLTHIWAVTPQPEKAQSQPRTGAHRGPGTPSSSCLLHVDPGCTDGECGDGVENVSLGRCRDSHLPTTLEAPAVPQPRSTPCSAKLSPSFQPVGSV